MDVLEAIQQRRSIRNYKDTKIEEIKLKSVLEAGRLAPSARNRQEWKFIVVEDKEARKQLEAAAYNQKFVSQAPVVIAACATESEHVMTCGQPAYTVDVSIALAFMILEAHELGLGTCWLGRFDEEEVKRILAIPENIRVVALTPLGYPNENPAPKPRKSREDVICYEKYK